MTHTNNTNDNPELGTISWSINIAKKMQDRARKSKYCKEATGKLAAALASERGYIVDTLDNPADNGRKFILAADVNVLNGKLCLTPIR